MAESITTTTRSIEDIVETRGDCPLNPSLIPNALGINLCCTDEITWTRMPDGQLISLTVRFRPNLDLCLANTDK